MNRPQCMWSRGRLCALAATGICLLGFAAPTVQAAESLTVGWWWKGQPSGSFPLAVSPVPAVPDGGFYVASDPTGPSGISALRFVLEPGARPQTLTITVADSIGFPVVEACAPEEPWEATDGGEWDERPIAACDVTQVSGTVSEDGSEISFDLAVLGADQVVDLVLVPAGEPAEEQTPPFSASFEAPDSQALTLQARSTTTTGTAPDSSEPTPGVSGTEPTTGSPKVSTPTFTPTTEPSSPGESEDDGSQAVAVRPVPTNSNTTKFPTSEDFAYPAVLALPLALLGLASYLANVLTRPVAARVGGPTT